MVSVEERQLFQSSHHHLRVLCCDGDCPVRTKLPTLHGFSNRGAMAASPGQDWCRVTTASANEWDPRSRPSLFTDKAVDAT